MILNAALIWILYVLQYYHNHVADDFAQRIDEWHGKIYFILN